MLKVRGEIVLIGTGVIEVQLTNGSVLTLRADKVDTAFGLTTDVTVEIRDAYGS